MKIIGTRKEIDFIEYLVNNPQNDYECDDCPMFEQCEEHKEFVGNMCCSQVIWNFIETEEVTE